MALTLYAARVRDLIDGENVPVDCLTCGHEASVQVATIKAKRPANESVVDLWKHLWCSRCRTKNAAGSVGKALGLRDAYGFIGPR